MVVKYGRSFASSFYRFNCNFDYFLVEDSTSGKNPNKNVTFLKEVYNQTVYAYDQDIPYSDIDILPIIPNGKNNQLRHNCSLNQPKLYRIEGKLLLRNGLAQPKALSASCFPGGNFYIAFISSSTLEKYTDLDGNIEDFSLKKVYHLFLGNAEEAKYLIHILLQDILALNARKVFL